MNEPVPTDLRNVAPGHEPVAVVGLACRLPGADGPAAYWNLLTEGRSAVTDTPDDRRDGAPADGWPLPNGGTAPHRGGFITAPADFDAAFFGISPREADAMDPQARLALELGWEALEHAGIPAASAPGPPPSTSAPTSATTPTSYAGPAHGPDTTRSPDSTGPSSPTACPTRSAPPAPA